MSVSVHRFRPVHAVLALAVVALLAGLGRPQSEESPEQQPVGTRAIVGTPIVGYVVAINNVADYNWKSVSGGGGTKHPDDPPAGVGAYANQSLDAVYLGSLTLSGPLVTPRPELTGWFGAMESLDASCRRPVTVWAMMADGKAAEVYGYGGCFITRYVFPKLVVGSSSFVESLVIRPDHLLTGRLKINACVDGLARAPVEAVATRGVRERALPTAAGQPVSFRIAIDGIADFNSRLHSIEIGDAVFPDVKGQPGQPRFGDITLRCRAQSGCNELRDWWIEYAKGAEPRKNVGVQLLDAAGGACRTYDFRDCLPRCWAPGDLDPAKTSEPVLETLVLCVAGVDMG